MNTNDLITILAQSSQPKKPLSFTAALLLLLGGAAGLTACVIGIRPDLEWSSVNITALHKTILLVALTVTAGLFLNAVSKPLPQIRKVIPSAGVTFVLFLCSIVFELITTPIQQIGGYFLIVNFPECVFFVTLYGALGAFALMRLMKYYAPAHSKLAGMGIGFAAAATGALGYSIHCPLDSPIFIAVAYGMPVLVMSFIFKSVASRYIKW